jgi:hypothetical protein
MLKGIYELPLKLICAAVAKELATPARYDGEIDWEFIMDFGRRQGILPILYRGACLFGLEIPMETEKELKKADDLAVAAEAAQFVALNQMYALFEGRGITCLPLKGSLLRELYHSPHLRTMGDIDLLIEPFDPKENRNLMAELGFKSDSSVVRQLSEYDVVTDNYRLPPFIEVELHKILLPVVTPENVRRAFHDSMSRTVSIQGYHHIKRLAVQDDYLFLLSHLYKHYIRGGIGIRMLLDIWLFYSAYKWELDLPRLEESLLQMEILDFCQEIFQLCRVLFGEEEFSEISPVQEQIYLAGQLHEDIPMLVSSFINKKGQGKLSLFASIVFINREKLSLYFPALNKYPLLYPYYYFKRVFFVLRCRRTQLKQLFVFAFTKRGNEKHRGIQKRWGK